MACLYGPPLPEGVAPFRVQERLLGLSPATAVSGEMPLNSALGTNGNGADAVLGEGQTPISAAIAIQGNGAEGNAITQHPAEGNGAVHSEQPVQSAGGEGE